MDSGQKDLKRETHVDVLLDMGSGLILLQKSLDPSQDSTQNPKEVWRLPGGLIRDHEFLEEAALRRILETTGLEAELVRQFHTYSYENEHEGGAKIRVVYLARARGNARTGDGILENGLFHQMNLPHPIAWKQKDILNDFFLERY
jgi:8-oxo-dGTP diphosphatase